MPTPKIRSTAGALAGAAAALWLTPAYPHAVCGDRIFPATLAIDDPGVTDELTAAHSFSGCRRTPTASQELDIGAAGRRRSFPTSRFRPAVARPGCTPGRLSAGTRSTPKRNISSCAFPSSSSWPRSGFDVEWGGSATGSQVGEPNMYSPVLDVGLGFGALPTSMNFLRPFAVTGEVSTTTPGQAVWGERNVPHDVQLGLHAAIQPALLTMRTSARSATTSSSISFRPSSSLSPRRLPTPRTGTWGTTGTIQPGVVYMADKWQIAVEAVIPVNGASGHGAGVVASLDLFLDDIFPNSIGKPIFSQTPADVHRSPTMTRISITTIAASLALICASDNRLRPRPAREGDAARRRHGRLGERNPARVQRGRRAEILEGFA